MKVEKKKTGILGAGGFTGIELLSVLSKHKNAEVVYATSGEYSKKRIVDVFPFLKTSALETLEFSEHPQTIDDIPELDAIFLAVPDDVSAKWVPLLLKRNIKVIDISGIWRISDDAVSMKYYGVDRNNSETLKKAVYGMTEINRDKIKSAGLIANPGCYPTAAILPLWYMKDFLSDRQGFIFIDAKSGTSGAGGRKEKDGMPFSGVHENFRAYKTGRHQHEPEIFQELNHFLPNTKVNFTPHLLPLFRGIHCSVYINSNISIPPEEMKDRIIERTKNEPFIRYYSSPDEIELKNIQNTNFLDFSFYYDNEKKVLTIISAIDNLLKGAAGQAVQNFNLMLNFPETEGLI